MTRRAPLAVRLRHPGKPAAFLAALAVALAASWASAAATLGSGVVYRFWKGCHVVVADSSQVRVAMPKPDARANMRTVSQHGQDEGALAAINANFFGGPINYPCGAARGHGIQYPATYAEAGNCDTTMGWSRGKGAIFNSAGRNADEKFMPQFSELATGGGWLLQNGRRVDWNHAKLEAGRACTAVGMTFDRRKIIFVVTNSGVCSGQALQDVLLQFGASDALQLDGGGSSKMWLKGRGYVNDVREDRKPSVVIVAGSSSGRSGACPAGCGKLPCVEVAGFGPQCVGGPCQGGLGRVWNCDGSHRRRVRCSGGVVVKELCASACLPKPAGSHDVCLPCAAGNGLYCGGLLVIGDKNTLYRCGKGALTAARRCPGRCKANPPGIPDLCE